MKDLQQYRKNYLNQFKERTYGRNLLKTEDPFDSPTEECGIFGLYSENDLDTFSLSQFGLFALQHRGQEACGISVMKNGRIFNIKDEGLVLDVYKEIREPETFMGNSAIGHTRYTTAGDKKKYNFQPFFAKNEYDQIVLSIAHNGNLTNARQLKAELEAEGVVFKATSDSEVILRLIQKNLDLGLRGAIKETMEKIEGAYSVVGITRNKFFAFRDFHGIRPLVLGAIDEKTYVVASESVALDAVGAQYVRDILPGEIVYTNENETGAPREITPQKGDTFTIQEQWLDLDQNGRVTQSTTQQGGVLTFGDQPFTWKEQNAAHGDYVIGFIVKDLDGNATEVYTAVTVQ